MDPAAMEQALSAPHANVFDPMTPKDPKDAPHWPQSDALDKAHAEALAATTKG